MIEILSENQLVLVITTESNIKTAKSLAKNLLEKKYAACINFTEIKSSFWWHGKLEESDEIQLLIKTREDNLRELTLLIKSLHTYENPEIISWKVSASQQYANWTHEVMNSRDFS